MALSASICRPADLGFPELDQWRRIQAATGMRDPFLSAEFACCVGLAFREARVAVIDDGAQRIGFLAFMKGRFGAAHALAGYLANMQGFVAAPGDWTIERVLRAAGIERFEFARWNAAQPLPGPHRRLDMPVIDLSDGFAAFLSAARARGGRLIKTMDQKRRSEERRDPDLRFEFCTEDLAVLDRLLAWKSQWLRRTGRDDVLADPRVRELIELTTAYRSPSFRGAVSCLRSGDRVLAVFCDLLGEGTLDGWWSAYDPDAGARSPGSVGLLCNIEAATQHEITSFHLGPGSAPQKVKLANRAITVIDGRFERTQRADVSSRLALALGGVQRG